MRLTVCEHDTELHRRARAFVQTLHLADALNRAIERVEDEQPDRPEDCNKPCWRHVDGGSQCECDDETEGGVWGPGC